MQQHSGGNAQICNEEVGKGFEGSQIMTILQKLKVGGGTHGTGQLQAEHLISMEANTNAITTSKQKDSPKILCSMYTYDKKHSTNLQTIVDIWAWKCDGFFAASTLTDPVLGAANLTHEGEENYHNMWQKVRSIWGYIYENYLDDYDYFWLGGDDVLLIVENLRNYLVEVDGNVTDAANTPIFLGSIVGDGGGFVHGGPGYVLNREALRRFATEALPTCKVRTIAVIRRF